MANKVVLVAKSNFLNGLTAISLGIYLLAVVFQGNSKDFLKTIWADLSGKQPSHNRAFWQWALALGILYYLASNDSTEEYFAPFLAIALVALLISLATAQPALFKNLTSALNSAFGGT